jgi:hypothetical protein
MRMLLGGISGLLAVGYIAFFLWADGFRRSWGASPNAPWKLFVPLAVMLLITASTIFPGNRILLHLTAIAVAATAVGCIVILREAPVMASLGLLYCVAWGWFYWAARRIVG